MVQEQTGEGIDASQSEPRYCTTCGDIATDQQPFCPGCGTAWEAEPSQHIGLPAVAALLDEFYGLRTNHVLGPTCYQALRLTYERRLQSLRPVPVSAAPAPAPVPAIPPPIVAPAPPTPAQPLMRTPAYPRPRVSSPYPALRPKRVMEREPVPEPFPEREPARSSGRPASLLDWMLTLRSKRDKAAGPSEPPKPPKPPGPSLAEWTAQRQADILLYVGAFLMSIAALIFVGYQGEALSGPVRFSVLLAYTLGFLTLGLVLPRWERVKEASTVFLVLGALLVPVNFLALRTQVLGDSNVPDDVIALAGSLVTAGLYFTLARGGHGRLYAIPGAIASVVAWGALGSVLNLGREWNGAWWLAAAAVTFNAATFKQAPALTFIRGCAVLTGVGALAAAHAAALTDDSQTAQLPVAYLLATTGVAGEVYQRRSSTAIELLPALVAMTLGTGAWSALGIGYEWYGVVVATAGLGYLVVAELDRMNSAEGWTRMAAVAGGLALLMAHVSMTGSGVQPGALPATYALCLAGAIAVYIRHRRPEALGTLPALTAAFGATTLWAGWSMPYAWLGVWTAGAAAGYLLITETEPDAKWRLTWRACMWVAGAAALGWTHLAVVPPDAQRATLPIVYGMLLACALRDTARRDAATGLVPALAAGFGASTLWVGFGMPLGWLGAWIAATAAGYIAVAEIDRARQQDWRQMAGFAGIAALMASHGAVNTTEGITAVLPVTYGLLLAAALWDGWRRRDVGLGTIPPLAAGLGAVSLWSGWRMPLEWLSVWVVLGAAGYLVLAEIDPSRTPLWRLAAAGGTGAALGYAHLGAITPGTSIWQLPLSYAIALSGSVWDGWRRRDAAMGAIPPLAAAFGATTLWAGLAMPREWLSAWLGLAVLGYLALMEIDPPRAPIWRVFAAAGGGATLTYAHLGVLVPGTMLWQLPVAYGLMLTGAVWDGWRRRDTAQGVIPPLAAGFGATFLRAGWGMSLEWLPVWIALAGLGYLALIEIDPPCARRWRLAAAVVGGAALVGAHQVASGITANPWQLVTSYSVVLAGAGWDGWRRRDAGLLTLPALAAMTAGSALWAAGVAPVWWIYPGLAAVLVILVTEPWWRGQRVLRDAGWPYALGSAVALLFLWMELHREQPAHGLVSHAVVAGVFFTAAWRSRGALNHVFYPPKTPGVTAWERRLLGQIGGALLFSTAAYFNAWAGLTGADRAWAYAALGSVLWLIPAGAGLLRRDIVLTFAPSASAATLLATGLSVDTAAQATLILTLAAAGPLVVFATTRRWFLTVAATAFGAGAIAAGWQWRELAEAGLPVAYAVTAALLWGGLARIRRYEQDERGLAVTALSWGPWTLALLMAYFTVTARYSELSADEALVRTREWATAALTLALAAAAVTLEGIRLSRRLVWTAGTVGLLAAGLLTISTSEPANVQAYSLPCSLYLIGLGCSYRRSPALWGPRLSSHEAVIVMGELLMVLPPAQQSFGPNGGLYGLELILIGLVFLAAGLVLTARWFMAGGVLTLSGVAARWLFIFGSHAPYWLTLGIVGSLLLTFGLLLLLERERWDALRARVTRWWRDAPPGPHLPHHM